MQIFHIKIIFLKDLTRVVPDILVCGLFNNLYPTYIQMVEQPDIQPEQKKLLNFE